MSLADLIPEITAYRQSGRVAQDQQMGQLQQMGALQGLLAKQKAVEEEQAVKGILARSGGDPEAAMKIALEGGYHGVAEKLVPMVKLAQAQKERQSTVEGLRSIYGGVEAPTTAGGDAPSPTGLTVPPGTPGEAPAAAATPREARIKQLQAMSLIPAYANNPIVMQKLQAEMDKLAQPEAAPKMRTRISGDQEIQEEFDTKTQTWKQLGTGPRFARQVAPVINMGASEGAKGDFTKTGDEFLQTIPASQRDIVKKLANYEINPQALSSKGGHRETMLSLASRYNPDYDDTQYANKRRAITQFGSGPQGNTVRSLNVAIEHIDTLQRAADALKNGEFTPGNLVYNEVAKVFGKTPPNTFEGIRDIVANEVIKGTIGNAGALADRAEAAAKVKASSSPAQLKELMNGWTELMGGQVKGLEQQYSGASGLKDFRSRFLTKRTLDAIATAESKATGGAPAAATLSPQEQQELDALRSRFGKKPNG